MNPEEYVVNAALTGQPLYVRHCSCMSCKQRGGNTFIATQEDLPQGDGMRFPIFNGPPPARLDGLGVWTAIDYDEAMAVAMRRDNAALKK